MEPILPSLVSPTPTAHQSDSSITVSADDALLPLTISLPESTHTQLNPINSSTVLAKNLSTPKDPLKPPTPPLPNLSHPSVVSPDPSPKEPLVPPLVSPPPADSTVLQAPFNLLLTSPPLPLRDRNNKLNLLFSACIHLTTPSENWRTLLLFHTHSFHLTLTLTYNTHFISGNSVLGESFARLLSSLPIWAQLDFSPSLSIFQEEIQITLLRSTCSAVESLLPELLPTARIPEIKMEFAFEGRGKVSVGMLAPLADVAVRSFWGDKVARLAPFMGRVGFLRECEARREYVGIVARVLEGFRLEGGEGRGNVKAQLWRAVLKNLVTRDNLEGLDLAAVAGEMKEEFDPTKEGIEDVEMLDFEALPERKDEWESEGFGGYGDSDDDTLLWDDEDRERVDVNFCDEWSSDDGLISSDGEDELWAAPETGDDEIWEALEKTKEDSDEDVFESYEWEEMMKGMAW